MTFFFEALIEVLPFAFVFALVAGKTFDEALVVEDVFVAVEPLAFFLVQGEGDGDAGGDDSGDDDDGQPDGNTAAAAMAVADDGNTDDGCVLDGKGEEGESRPTQWTCCQVLHLSHAIQSKVLGGLLSFLVGLGAAFLPVVVASCCPLPFLQQGVEEEKEEETAFSGSES